MIVGFRNLLLASALGGACLANVTLGAEDPVQTELASLREAVKAQNDQIARLTTEVARMNALLDSPHRTDAAPTATPSATAPAPGPAAAPAPEAPRPNVLPPANVHVIVKGDSLDKIAKQHGITVAELQKMNKISDPKKLQIGQQLVLPPSADKAPAAPEKTDKKDPQ